MVLATCRLPALSLSSHTTCLSAPLPFCPWWPHRFYQKLSGMTGTAKSAAAEFYEIYGLRVVPIPTNKPPRRQDLPLRLYYTEKVSQQDKLLYSR